MLPHLVGRALRALLTLAIMLSLSFVFLRLAGDPASIMLSPDAPPETIEAFRRSQGPDRPLWRQYLGYVANVLQGDFGQSMREGTPAMQTALERLPATLAIVVPAFVLQLLVGVTAGIHAALHRNALMDHRVMGLPAAGCAIPGLMPALALVLVAVGPGWLASGGYGTAGHALLPILALGLGGAAVLARFMRSAMLEVLGRPYVRTALAKGLSGRQVVLRHALPNAAIPMLAVSGLMIGGLIAGAVVVENMFSWPGAGRLLVGALADRDLPVVQAILLLAGASLVAARLVVDALHGLIDPRISRNPSRFSGS